MLRRNNKPGRMGSPSSSPRPSTPRSPSPSEINAVAKKMGYTERRTEVSSTLFYRELNPPHDMPPALVNIYYTTRSIMTFLNHPLAGPNEMWRSNAYDSIEELMAYLANPRIHTGKGYRNKNKAVRGCVKCGEMKQRTEFSNNQWLRKGPDANICKGCQSDAADARSETSTLDGKKQSRGNDYRAGRECSNCGEMKSKKEFSKNQLMKGPGLNKCRECTAVIDLNRSLNKFKISGSKSGNNILASDDDNSDYEFPNLTEKLLDQHNKHSPNRGKGRKERRQFNCPRCPKEGRGRNVFFKKVPAMKPVVKCPKCKVVSGGRCTRLYAIAKRSEKGYGLFKCGKCPSK